MTLLPDAPLRVLVVEDSPTIRLAVRKALSLIDAILIECPDATSGLEAVRSEPFDVVLLDRHLPDADGLEILAELTADPRTANVPVLFLTGDSDPQTLVRALEVGAHDFLRKPFLAEELIARVRVASRTKRLTDELRAAAGRDPLTGLLNRRAFREVLNAASALSSRHTTPLSMLLIDLSSFKAINDTYGHGAGDAVLVAVARRLEQGLRTGDAVGRWGGDEYVIMLPQTDLAGARVLATRLRDRVEAVPVDVGAKLLNVSMTVGAATRMQDCIDPEGIDLMRRADEDMYAQRGPVSAR